MKKYSTKALVTCLFLIIYQFSTAQEITYNLSSFQGGVNVSCHGATDGWISIVVVGGTPPYLFNWSNGSFQQNQSGLGAGSYSVTVTDMASNTTSITIQLLEPSSFSITLEPIRYEGNYHISENGGSDGEIKITGKGGVLPYNYLWNNGLTDEVIRNLTAGSYSVVLTDLNGCSTTSSITLIEPTALEIQSITSPLHNGYNISCYEGNDGSIDLTVSGGVPPYTFQWSNGRFTEDINELGNGTYWVLVRDANGSEVAGQILLRSPQPNRIDGFTPSIYPPHNRNISCFGCANGSLQVNVIGGIPPYTYNWSNGEHSNPITNLSAGVYSVIVYDENGCPTYEKSFEMVSVDKEDWGLTGNNYSNLSPSPFLGTIDNQDLILKTANAERLRINALGQISIPSFAGTGLRRLTVDQTGRLQPDPNPIQCVEWLTCGNNLTAAATLGSLNLADVIFKANGIELMRLKSQTGTVSLSGFAGQSAGLLKSGISGDIEKLDFTSNTFRYLKEDGSWSNLPVGSNLWNTSGNTIYNTVNGFIGVGTNNATDFLDIHFSTTDPKGISLTNHESTNWNSEVKFCNTNGQLWSIGSSVGHNNVHDFFIYDFVNSRTSFLIDNDGRVGIGLRPPSTSPLYKLFVEGGIATRDILVTSGTFPDYVFLDNYPLLSIKKLNEYIIENKHLPNIPSAVEVKDGFEIGEMQRRIIQTLEEQALYIIQLQKEIEDLRSKYSNR